MNVYREIMSLFEVTAANLYNMDETGLQLGMLCNAKQVIPTEGANVNCHLGHTQESITFIECISVLRRILSPMIILAAKTHRDS